MSTHLVTIQILSVENEQRTSKRTGNDYTHFAARSVLLNEAGLPVTVGTIRSDSVSPEIRDEVKPGLYRAGFSLVVPDFGKDQGNVVSRLVQLMPVTAPRAPVAPSKPA